MNLASLCRAFMGRRKTYSPVKVVEWPFLSKWQRKLRFQLQEGNYYVKHVPGFVWPALPYGISYISFVNQLFSKNFSVLYIYCSNLHEFLFQLKKSKHYCGICKKIWNHSDSGSWVRQFTCYSWVLFVFLIVFCLKVTTIL